MIAWIVYWWQWRRRSWKQRYYAVRYVRERRAMRRRVEAEMRDEFTAEGMDYDAWRRRLSFSCDRDSVDESAGMRKVPAGPYGSYMEHVPPRRVWCPACLRTFPLDPACFCELCPYADQWVPPPRDGA